MFFLFRQNILSTAQKRQRLLIRCGLWLLGGFVFLTLLHSVASGTATPQVGYGSAYSSTNSTGNAPRSSQASQYPEAGGVTSRSSGSASTTGQTANMPGGGTYPSCTSNSSAMPSQYPEAGATNGCASSQTPSSILANQNTGASGWLQSAMQGAWHAILGGFVDGINQLIDTLKSLALITRTPEPLTYGNNVVITVVPYMVFTVDAALVLFLIIGGYQYMLGYYESFRELAPRLIVAVIAAHFSLSVLTQFILLSNALCDGVMSILKIAGLGMPYPPTGFQWASAADYWIVAFLIEAIGVLLLSLQMLTRIALLDLCLILAPLGLLCFALPQTRAWGRLWAQAFVSALIVQFLQLICLALGSGLIAGLGHAEKFNPVNILVGIAVLFLAAKIPDMLLTNVLQASKDTGKAMVETVKTGVEMAALL